MSLRPTSPALVSKFASPSSPLCLSPSSPLSPFPSSSLFPFLVLLSMPPVPLPFSPISPLGDLIRHSYYRMCPLTTEYVLLLQNVSSYNRM